jgi:hypothetical protein
MMGKSNWRRAMNKNMEEMAFYDVQYVISNEFYAVLFCT